MGASIWNGPLHAYGDMGNLVDPTTGLVIVPDPNSDAGPDLSFQGIGLLDFRYFYPKDKVQGYVGVVPAHYHNTTMVSANQIPGTVQTNNIAAAQTVTSGTAMTLAAASATTLTGATVTAIPIYPFAAGGGSLNSGTIVNAMALDFGFAFGTVVANNATVTVADSTLFSVGMPLVIAGVGTTVAGAAPLLTQVATIPTSTTITLISSALPLVSLNPAAIGTGNYWGPSENGFPLPTAALPYLAKGPALFLDDRQAVTRCIQIAGTSAACTGGTFLVSGYDIYGVPLTQLITVAAGASTTFSTKCFKYIASVVPQFTDTTAGHTYTVGTGDVFEFSARADIWEFTSAAFAGVTVPTTTGFVAAVTTSPATTTTGSTRGTIQSGTNGAGTGFTGGTASNGTVSSLAMTGRRLYMAQDIQLYNALRGVITNPAAFYGVAQV